MHNFSGKQSSCVSLGQMGDFFAYTLLGDYVILTTEDRDGLWCLDPESQTYANLLDNEEYSYLNVSQEPDGSVSTQLTGSVSGKMRIADPGGKEVRQSGIRLEEKERMGGTVPAQGGV